MNRRFPLLLYRGHDPTSAYLFNDLMSTFSWPIISYYSQDDNPKISVMFTLAKSRLWKSHKKLKNLIIMGLLLVHYVILVVVLLIVGIALPTIIIHAVARRDHFNTTTSEAILDEDVYQNVHDLYSQIERLSKSLDFMCHLKKIGKMDREPLKPLPLYMIEISGGMPKKKILVISGIFGNSWEAVPTALSMVRAAVVEKTFLLDILANYDLDIVPIMNPLDINLDFEPPNATSTTNSNETTQSEPRVNFLYNFDYKFNSSAVPKDSVMYGGTEPFSQPESKLLKEHFKKNDDKIAYVFFLHTSKSNQSEISYPVFEDKNTTALLDYLSVAASLASDGKYVTLRDKPNATFNGRVDYWIVNQTKIFKVFNINSSRESVDDYPTDSNEPFKLIAQDILEMIAAMTKISSLIV